MEKVPQTAQYPGSTQARVDSKGQGFTGTGGAAVAGAARRECTVEARVSGDSSAAQVPGNVHEGHIQQLNARKYSSSGSLVLGRGDAGV